MLIKCPIGRKCYVGKCTFNVRASTESQKRMDLNGEPVTSSSSMGEIQVNTYQSLDIVDCAVVSTILNDHHQSSALNYDCSNQWPTNNSSEYYHQQQEFYEEEEDEEEEEEEEEEDEIDENFPQDINCKFYEHLFGVTKKAGKTNFVFGMWILDFGMAARPPQKNRVTWDVQHGLGHIFKTARTAW
jgi:hypothetical protein